MKSTHCHCLLKQKLLCLCILEHTCCIEFRLVAPTGEKYSGYKSHQNENDNGNWCEKSSKFQMSGQNSCQKLQNKCSTTSASGFWVSIGQVVLRGVGKTEQWVLGLFSCNYLYLWLSQPVPSEPLSPPLRTPEHLQMSRSPVRAYAVWFLQVFVLDLNWIFPEWTLWFRALCALITLSDDGTEQFMSWLNWLSANYWNVSHKQWESITGVVNYKINLFSYLPIVQAETDDQSLFWGRIMSLLRIELEKKLEVHNEEQSKPQDLPT